MRKKGLSNISINVILALCAAVILGVIIFMFFIYKPINNNSNNQQNTANTNNANNQNSNNINNLNNNNQLNNYSNKPNLQPSVVGGSVGGSGGGGNPSHSPVPGCIPQCVGKMYWDDDGCRGHCTIPPIPWTNQNINWTQTSKFIFYPNTRSFGIYRANETINVSTNDGASIKIFNIRGEKIYDGSSPFISDKVSSGEYFVETSGDRSEFFVLPSDYSGTDFITLGADLSDKNLLDLINSSYTRAQGGINWAEVRPTNHSWDWSKVDMAINYYPWKNLIYEGFIRPDWLTNDSKFMDEYIIYAKNSTQRFNGKISIYEIWNEPWYTEPLWGALPFTNDTESLVNSLTIVLGNVTPVIHSINSSIKILSPDWQGDTQTGMTELMNKSGALNYIDIYTFHDYRDGQVPPDTGGWVAAGDGSNGKIYFMSTEKYIDAYTSALNGKTWAMNEAGLYGQSAIGIPGTERGGTSSYLSNNSWYVGMNRAVKQLVIYKSKGALFFMPHVLIQGTSPDNNLEIYGFDAMRGTKPKTASTFMTAYWINSATYSGNKLINNNNTFIYSFTRPGETLAFVWAAEGNQYSFNSSGFNETDIFGNNISVNFIGEEPILFHRKDLNSTQLLNSISNAFNFCGNGIVDVGEQCDGNNLNGILCQSLGYSSGTLACNSQCNFDRVQCRLNYQGLVGYWPLNGTANDYSGNNLNGNNYGVIFNNSELPVSGIFNGNSFINISNNNQFSFGPNKDFSIVLNYKIPKGDSNFSVMLGNKNSGTDESGFSLFKYAASYLKISNGSISVSNNLQVSSTNDNNWHHVVFSIDRTSNCNIYVDGLLYDSQLCSSWSNLNLQGQNSLYVGSIIAYGSASNYFNGSMKGIRIFNRTLSSQEALNLYLFDTNQQNSSGNVVTSISNMNGNVIGNVGKTSYINIILTLIGIILLIFLIFIIKKVKNNKYTK